MKPFRYLVKKSEPGKYGINFTAWEVFKCYVDDTRGELVGFIYDKETVELLTQAPAMRQMHDRIKRTHPELGLRPREYTRKTLRDYSAAFIGFLRKL